MNGGYSPSRLNCGQLPERCGDGTTTLWPRWQHQRDVDGQTQRRIGHAFTLFFPLFSLSFFSPKTPTIYSTRKWGCREGKQRENKERKKGRQSCIFGLDFPPIRPAPSRAWPGLAPAPACVRVCGGCQWIREESHHRHRSRSTIMMVMMVMITYRLPRLTGFILARPHDRPYSPVRTISFGR